MNVLTHVLVCCASAYLLSSLLLSGKHDQGWRDCDPLQQPQSSGLSVCKHLRHHGPRRDQAADRDASRHPQSAWSRQPQQPAQTGWTVPSTRWVQGAWTSSTRLLDFTNEKLCLTQRHCIDGPFKGRIAFSLLWRQFRFNLLGRISHFLWRRSIYGVSESTDSFPGKISPGSIYL